MKLNLNLAQLSSSIDTQRPMSHHSTASRIASKRGLDPSIIQSSLESLDVFRDLLEGIPHQKNRVVRDVCKNVEMQRYMQGDVIYDLGEKANAVYFCISGAVSICITKQVVKQPPKQQCKQSQQSPQKKQTHNNANPQCQSPLPQQKSFRNQPQQQQCPQQQQQQNSSRISTQQNIQTSPTSNNNINLLQQIQQTQKIDQQIDLIQSGQGFGQAQFISQSKRSVKAIAKTVSVIAKLEIQHFTQVLQNYKQRVYYKKRDMFQKCALFAKLPPNKLQFIINNTKPMTINISNKLVTQGTAVDTVYLVNKGQVALCKRGLDYCQISQEEDSQNQQQEQKLKISKSAIINKNKILLKKLEKQKIPHSNSTNNSVKNSKNKLSISQQLSQQQPQSKNNPNMYQQNQDQQKLAGIKSQLIIKRTSIVSSALKLKADKSPLPKEKDHKIFVGLLTQGCFLGDLELVLGTQFRFNAVCLTQKAQVYYCDRRIILSQLTQQNLAQAQPYYTQKQKYLTQKLKSYHSAKRKIEKQQKIDLLPPLTKDQIQLKRKLMHRYVEDKNTLIGQSSPSDIAKMIRRKQLRVIKQPEISRFPILELFPSHSVKKRAESPLLSPRSFNPLSLVQVPGRKCITQFDQYNPQNQKQSQKITSSRKLKRFSTVSQSPELYHSQNPQPSNLSNSDLNLSPSHLSQQKQQPQQLTKLKSIMIKIKPSKLDFSDLKYGQQKNMAIVGKILGRYRKCENKFRAINDIISKIQKNRT